MPRFDIASLSADVSRELPTRRFQVRRVEAEFLPVNAEQLDRVLGPVGAIAAGQRSRGAVPVAAPAGTLGVLRICRKFLGHCGLVL